MSVPSRDLSGYVQTSICMCDSSSLATGSRLPAAHMRETWSPVQCNPDTLRRVKWDDLDTMPLFESIRSERPGADAERTVWAFERALEVARIDPELLEHLLVACVCLVAREQRTTPRTVLEHTFRRAVGDRDWRERFAPLLS